MLSHNLTVSASIFQNYFLTANFRQILATTKIATRVNKILNMNLSSGIIFKKINSYFNLQENLSISHYFIEVAVDSVVSSHFCILLIGKSNRSKAFIYLLSYLRVFFNTYKDLIILLLK